MKKKITSSFINLLAIFCLVFILFFSCTKNKNKMVDAAQKVESISLSSVVYSMEVGFSAQLDAIVLPENAKNKDLVWSSNDITKATVNQQGKVTAIGLGLVTIKVIAKDGSGKTKSISLKITEDDFVSTWKGKQITIPTTAAFSYNYHVDWNNDGIFDEFGLTSNVTHVFDTNGVHKIRICGDFPRVHFEKKDTVHSFINEVNLMNGGKIISIDQWGT
ncbi:Ig-like domain-containing protein [Flavobacterium sp. W22_SRS_FK3]|uniref:Ig-like domain-containing protein n=1 Tax=Flavobacterium sp. W22_SRS_FK3 TaxID=3240275 RepID=UPI003F913419